MTRKHSEETKQKMSESARGENNGFYGKKHSEETKDKISKLSKGENNGFYGRKHSEETKIKIRENIRKRTAELSKNKVIKKKVTKKKEIKKKTRKSTKGKNNSFYGKKHSEETLKKISESRKGKCVGEENPFYGKKHSEETRKKISKAVKEANKKRGKIVFSEEHRRRLSEASKGKKKSKEHRENWKKSIEEKYGVGTPSLNQEIKEKIRQAHIGTKHSEETKKKLKASQARLQETYWTLEKRKEYSEMMKERFRKNPEMHPTRILSKTKMSGPEKIVCDYLTSEKIEFEFNKRMAPYFVDFVVNGLGIEVDGEYWHKGREDYDKERDQYIKKQYGMDIVRFPASRIIDEDPQVIDENLCK